MERKQCKPLLRAVFAIGQPANPEYAGAVFFVPESSGRRWLIA
jgi:hypothetical protein